MTTVYVVTQGEYSSYKILSVFSERSVAQAFIEQPMRFGWGDARIEEYQLDEFAAQMREGLTLWRVVMDRGGNVKEAEVSDSYYLHSSDRPWGANVELLAWATDEQHAIKIANDRRAQMIANGDWPPDKPPPLEKAKHEPIATFDAMLAKDAADKWQLRLGDGVTHEIDFGDGQEPR